MNSTDRPGLYLHVPFCRSKCPYCDFYSVSEMDLIPSWFSALTKEALLYKGTFSTFDSVYLGGGTPSVLDQRHLATLLDFLRQIFTFTTDAEITIEANPGDLSREKLMGYRHLGINRISLGVQSFNDQELQFLGRRHTSKEAIQALELIRGTGFANLGLDLIYGFQGQSEAGWQRTMEQALQFCPEHISCYQLSLDDSTPLGKMKAEGRIHTLSEEQESVLFLMTSRYFSEHGFLHYEISSFSRGSEFRSRHNQKYWRHVPYLGLGPSAHSFKGGLRWWNVRSLATYIDTLHTNAQSIEGKETLTAEQLNLESLYLGLRTSDGVQLEAVRSQPGSGAALDELRRSGLVRVDDGRIIPTIHGFLVADSLPILLS